MERVALRSAEKPAVDFIKTGLFSRDGTFSYQVHGTNETGFVQIQLGSRAAALTYSIAEQDSEFSMLVEALCRITGKAGRFHLLANAPAQSEQWHLLKANGFHTCTVQTIWRINTTPSNKTFQSLWSFETEEDQNKITAFYSQFFSPLERSLHSWKFPDIFHLVYHDPSGSIGGIARVLSFADRALLFPMLDAQCKDPERCITSLIQDCSKYFSILFVGESTAHPLSESVLGANAEMLVSENHRMVRNLAANAVVNDFHPADLLKENGIAKPSTPFSHS